MIEYWKFFHRYAKKTEKLSDQELGRLVRALNEFSITGERKELAGRESIAFDFIADDIEQNQKAYDRKCEINSANASERKRTVTTAADASDGSENDKQKQKQKQKQNVSPDGDTEARARDVFIGFAGEDHALLEALQGFDEMRRKIKKPLTDRAKGMLCTRLKKYPRDKWISMLSEATLHCWQDVYPKTEESNGRAAVSYDTDAAEAEAAQGAPVYQRRGKKDA